MNVSAWAIRNPIPIFLLFLLLTIMGWQTYKLLGINQWPDVDFPMIVVTVQRPGAAAAELETDVTRKVEDAVVGLNGLDHIRSTIVEGASTTILEFEVGHPTDTALNDTRDAVTRIRQQLPSDVDEPIISHPNGSGDAFITYTISSERRSVGELSRLVDEDITRALLTVTGVAEVQRDGGLTREVRVRLSPARLQAMGTSVDFVTGQLRQLNLNLPGGKSALGGGEIGIRTLGSAKSIEDLAAMQIPLASGSMVRLDTLGTVELAYADVASIARVDGKPVVGFSVIKAQGAPLVQTEDGVRKQVTILEKALPADIDVHLVRTQATFTRAAFHASIDALLLGAALAVVVIYAFLRNWQSTVISGLAIPLSVLPTFWIMGLLGYSLNGMTTLALTLVVGILVDDAIVDLENIYRHIGMGKTPLQAAFEATDEIGLAIVATTMTIVAVFIPVGFMGGIPGMFFRSFGVTVAIAVLFSLLVARTLTPMMAAYLLPKTAKHADEDTFYRRWYQVVLTWALRHRWLTLAGAVVVFVGSMALVPIIPKGFVKIGDIGQAMVTVSLPAGSTVADTERVVLAASRILEARPETKLVFSTVGSGASFGVVQMGGNVTRGTINAILVPKHDRTISLDAYQDLLRPALAGIPGARVAFAQFGATGSPKPVNILLRGADGAQLNRVGDKLLAEMRAMPELRDVTSTAAELRPEVQIRPNLQAAAEQGVSVTTIGRLARLGTQGDVDFNLAKFNAGTQQLNIRVQLADTARQDLAAIGDLLVPGREGLVPLRTVADIALGTGPVQIDRYDRARQITFTANLTGGNLGASVAKVQELPTMKNLPAGVSQGTVGESKVMIDIFTETLIALGTGVLFIYAVLVLLFGGFLQPLTIMMALPLSIGGAMAGLLVFGKELGLMALIGIIMLMGLVTKNSILLVEYVLRARDQGMPRTEALLHAAHDRVRPIIMTTIAMIAGMTPIALQLGEGTERLSPMAAAVIGGLITSTLLTLIVIPVAYTFVDDVSSFFARRFGWLWRARTNAPTNVAHAVVEPVTEPAAR